MMKFIKTFIGATGGSPYPTTFKAGDECPEDLLDVGMSLGAVEQNKSDGKKGEAQPTEQNKSDGKK